MIRRRYAERLAGDILGRLQIKAPPVDPSSVARKLGASVVPQRDDTGDRSGLVARRGTEVIIGVNSAHSDVRQRFTVAHEIGHMLLHADEALIIDGAGYSLIGERKEGESSPREIEANAFAAALLMPSQWIAEALREKKIDLSDDSALSVLAKRFRVSQQAMMFRLVNLGHLQNF